jgi:hypothetical protein
MSRRPDREAEFLFEMGIYERGCTFCERLKSSNIVSASPPERTPGVTCFSLPLLRQRSSPKNRETAKEHQTRRNQCPPTQMG